jgi:orotate phosphoribosyltransferase-like protein
MAGNEIVRTYNRASSTKVRNAARRQEALELRKAGLTFERIGARMGVTKQTAHQLVLRAFGELREKLAETAEQVLTLELQRLDALTEALWPTATAGDPQAIDRVLRIMQRRAALLGLDALARVLPSETVPETLGSRVCIYLPDNQRGDLPVEVPEGLSE